MSMVKKTAATAALTASAFAAMAGVAGATEQSSTRVVDETVNYSREVVKESFEHTKRVVEHTEGYTKVLIKHGKCYVLKDGRWVFVGHYKDGKVVRPGKGTLLDLNLDLDLRVLQDKNGDSLIKVTL